MREQQTSVETENGHFFYRARILYMDDDAGLGRLLQKRLERMACLVDIARNGFEGMVMFEAGNYDVVIADYNMPGADGFEVLRKLKEFVPVIIITGRGDEGIAVEAMRLGAADYVAKDINGEYIELLPSIIDRVIERQRLIKDKEKAQAEQRASEARYRAIVEDQTELICRFRQGGQIVFFNAAFCRYFGVQQTEMATQNLTHILSKKAYQVLQQSIGELTPQNPVTTRMHKIKGIDGEYHWLQWTIRAIFNDASKLTEYQAAGRDATELRKAEAVRQESEERFGALLKVIPDVVLLIDQNGICTAVQPGQDHLAPKPVDIADLFPQDVVTLIKEHLRNIFIDGTDRAFQFSVKLPDGIKYREARLAPCGKKVIAALRDITGQTASTRQLEAQKEKLHT